MHVLAGLDHRGGARGSAGLATWESGREPSIWDEIERMAPSHSGLTREVLDSPAAMDGVVVP